MSTLCDYFSAPSDEVAATALGRGSPGLESDDDPPLPPFDTVCGTNIDPYVDLAQLEALLLGAESEVQAPRHCALVEDPEGEGAEVVDAISDRLQAAIAAADDARLAAIAVPWSKKFYDHADPEALAAWLRELAALARRSLARSEHLYCWYAA